MCKGNKFRQGDILYFDFSPSVNNEIRGIRPAVIVSSDDYNRRADYLTVMPITKHGNNFDGYVELFGYKNVQGRVNVMQMHSYSIDRVRSNPLDHMRVGDFDKIRNYIQRMIAC